MQLRTAIDFVSAIAFDAALGAIAFRARDSLVDIDIELGRSGR